MFGFKGKSTFGNFRKKLEGLYPLKEKAGGVKEKQEEENGKEKILKEIMDENGKIVEETLKNSNEFYDGEEWNQDSKKREKAREEKEKFVKEDLGKIKELCDKKDWDKSIEALEKIIKNIEEIQGVGNQEEDKEFIMKTLKDANKSFLEGEYGQSIEDLKTAKRYSMTYQEMLEVAMLLGWNYWETGEKEKAKECWDTVEFSGRFDRTNACAYAGLAKYYQGKDNKKALFYSELFQKILGKKKQGEEGVGGERKEAEGKEEEK